MKQTILIIVGLVVFFILGFYTSNFRNCNAENTTCEHSNTATQEDADTIKLSDLNLGAFSISMAVEDLEKSKAFYEKLGFNVSGGGMNMNYLIMKNGNALVGLFHGMFEGHILTFNPGWDESAQELTSFKDIRDLQAHFIQEGIDVGQKIDSTTAGPASLMFNDPDGNVILIDQHR